MFNFQESLRKREILNIIFALYLAILNYIKFIYNGNS